MKNYEFETLDDVRLFLDSYCNDLLPNESLTVEKLWKNGLPVTGTGVNSDVRLPDGSFIKQDDLDELIYG